VLRALTSSGIAQVAALLFLKKVMGLLNQPAQKTEKQRKHANTKSRRTNCIITARGAFSPLAEGLAGPRIAISTYLTNHI
jgi:hypothetical protein